MNAGKSRGNGQGLLNSSKTDNTEKEHGMRHPAYPKYKESGVEWLGKVPEHWAVKRLKYSATINDDTLPETTEPDFEFNYVDIGSVNPIEGITNTETMIFENAPSRARRKVAPGDTIVSTVRTYLRAIAPIPKTSETLIVSTGFAVIRPRKLNADFLAYALRESSFVESVVARSTGVSYPAINASEIGNIEIPLPPEDEQAAIADFLDRETGLIDALAAKKQRLIELLKEKRTALITRTVTRGLPEDVAREFGLAPHIRFKDSGIEWLGQIPEEWEVKRLKMAAYLNDKKVEADEENPVPYIGMENIESWTGKLLPIDPDVTPSGVANRFTAKNTLFGKLRPYLAKACNPSFDGLCSTELLVIESEDFDRRALLYWLLADGFIRLVDSSTYGSKMPRANWDFIGNCLLPVPPLPEQSAIAAYLDRETAKIDKLVEKIEAVVARLQEYRSALITAAVTGKIDVQTKDKEMLSVHNAGDSVHRPHPKRIFP